MVCVHAGIGGPNKTMKTLVSSKEIEEVGESLMAKYLFGKKPPPRCIDIEGFITDFLHLPIVYASIAEDDQDKIGFISDGTYPLQVMREGRREKVIYPKGTIVIDRFLLQPDKSAQRRFTLAHEAAHVIFERMSPTAAGPCFNRLYDQEKEYSIRELREHLDICESQTDRLASVLLMPRFLVVQAMKEERQGAQVPIYGSTVLRSGDKLSIQNMADRMGVSFTTLLIRLRELRFIEYRCISEYLESEMAF